MLRRRGRLVEDDDSVVIEEVEETEKSELEETAETAEPAEDAEKAEMLEENQELELESTDTMEKTTSDDPFDIDIAIQSLDEYTFDADTGKMIHLNRHMRMMILWRSKQQLDLTQKWKPKQRMKLKRK